MEVLQYKTKMQLQRKSTTKTKPTVMVEIVVLVALLVVLVPVALMVALLVVQVLAHLSRLLSAIRVQNTFEKVK